MDGSGSPVIDRVIKWGVAVDLKRCTGCQACTMGDGEVEVIMLPMFGGG